MIYIDAADRQAEHRCDVYPVNLGRERAEELRAIHSRCSPWTCSVRTAAVLRLVSVATELGIVQARHAARRRGLRR